MKLDGNFRKTLDIAWKWQKILNWRSVGTVAAIDIMHHWPGRHPVRRGVRLFCRHRRFRLTLKNRVCFKIEGRYDEYADYHAVCEIFLDSVYNLHSLAVPPSLIIDAGGHIGTFSILARAAFPEAAILTFEPDPQNFALLERNIKNNNLKIEARNLALADFEGSTLLEGPSSMGRHIGATQGAPVRVQRLSRLIRFAPETRLLIKIDVEGAEWRILEDCAGYLPQNTFMFIETHSGDKDLDKLASYCARWGFQHEHTNAKGEYHESILRRGVFASPRKES